MHTSLAPALPVAVLIAGLVVFAIGKRQRERLKSARATILSVMSIDSDWDEATVQFSVNGKDVSAKVPAPSEFRLSAQTGQVIAVRYDPSRPGSARLDQSLGKLRILGVFLLIVGSIWLALSLLWAR